MKVGPSLINKINDYSPTLLIALDFLFWFGHGYLPKDADEFEYRLKRLNQGLELLETLNCEIVLGNYPDVSFATQTVLSTRQVPSDKVRNAMNKKLLEWAEISPKRHVIDVFSLWKDAVENKPIAILNNTWPNETRKKLLQRDQLHVTLDGLIAACLLMVEKIGKEGFITEVQTIKLLSAELARE